MTTNDVLTRFGTITELSGTDLNAWQNVCEEAKNEIEDRIKVGLTLTASDETRLSTAAASLAFYRYTLYKASNTGMEAFTAGELQIKSDPKGAVHIALAAWQDSMRAAANLLTDSNFVFEGVSFK